MVRKEVLRLLMLIVLVHSVALAVYYFAGVERMPREARTVFTVIWTLLTLAVVLTGLRRVRLARGRTGRTGGRTRGRTG